MNTYWQLVIYFFAAINPASVALAMARRGEGRDRRTRWQLPAIGVVLALVAYVAVTFGAKRLLVGLDIAPESFRVAAGTVMATAGVLAIWRGVPGSEGEDAGMAAALFPLTLPLLVSPAGLVSAVSYSADDGSAKALGALAIPLVITFALLFWRPSRGMPALDAVARITGALLVAVAAGLVVDGVRAI